MRLVVLFAVLALMGGHAEAQVASIPDAPPLHFLSGDEIPVIRLFTTVIIETGEPAIALEYLTTKTKDDLCPEAGEVWNALQPLAEKANARAAFIFQSSSPGSGWTWIWKRGADGTWDHIKEDDHGRTANGLNGPDLVRIAQGADAIVHLRLVFKPGTFTDPRYPKVQQHVIDKVVRIQTLKANPGFLGEKALQAACAAWKPGGHWPSRAGEDSVDYLVFEKMPVGDFETGASTGVGSYEVPLTAGVLPFVERVLQEHSHSSDNKASPQPVPHTVSCRATFASNRRRIVDQSRDRSGSFTRQSAC